MGGFGFVVLGKAAIAAQPGEGAFDDPAFGKNLKARSDFGNDLQASALTGKEGGDPIG